MAKRKIVFVIVEGPSDDEALGVIFSKIYDRDSVYVHIMHGDITAQSGVSSSNMENLTVLMKKKKRMHISSRNSIKMIYQDF